MLNLFDEINGLEKWDYYSRKDEFSIKKIDNWNFNRKHICFIEDFLKLSGKIGIINFFKIKLDYFERGAHTNSVFFLGCLFYKKLDFKNKIKFTRNDRNDRNEFYFVWFLTSLVHDFGDDIENNKNNYKEVTNDIQSFIKEFSIKEKLLEQDIAHNSENMKKLIDYIPKYYEERFDGKKGRGTNGKIDHGIASGLLLYSGLVENRKDKEEKYGEIQRIDENNSIYWGKDLEKFYTDASYSIAIHNIRYPENTLKFSIEENPFLFLFWLADTIEPIKSFESKSCKAQYILENIIIEFHNNKKGFTIKNKQNSTLDFTKYKEKIESLKDFLDIEINTKETNEIILSW